MRVERPPMLLTRRQMGPTSALGNTLPSCCLSCPCSADSAVMWCLCAAAAALTGSNCGGPLITGVRSSECLCIGQQARQARRRAQATTQSTRYATVACRHFACAAQVFAPRCTPFLSQKFDSAQAPSHYFKSLCHCGVDAPNRHSNSRTLRQQSAAASSSASLRSTARSCAALRSSAVTYRLSMTRGA